MNLEQNYIIEKVCFEVNTANLETAYSIKNNIDKFIKDELLPELELVLDKYSSSDEIFRFSELNIDISVSKWNDFNDTKYKICNQFEEEIKKQIEKIQPVNTKYHNVIDQKENLEALGEKENEWNIFIYFLKNAHLPWFGKEEHLKNLSTKKTWEQCMKEIGHIQQLKDLLISSEVIQKRFIYQYPDDVVVSFLIEINLKFKKGEKRISKFLSKVDTKIRDSLLFFLFDSSFRNDKVVESFRSFMNQIRESEFEFSMDVGFESLEDIVQFVIINSINPILIDSDAIDLISKAEDMFDNDQQSEMEDNNIYETQNKEVSEPEDLMDKNGDQLDNEIARDKNLEYDIIDKAGVAINDEFGHIEKEFKFFEQEKGEIAVLNAGLVLLHPFMKQFFNQFGIVDESGMIKKEKFGIAVQSLHYLATGNENVFEGNLVFEKFLCGVPLSLPIHQESLLSGEIKDETELLLKEVIRNWTALKQTSPEGLQQLFLQRDGKLMRKDNKYKLIIERKPQDLLLAKLNWGIGVIKLPWWKHMLYVEW